MATLFQPCFSYSVTIFYFSLCSQCILSAIVTDIDECNSGSQKCVAGEQVCYNQPGSYSCINADGSLSPPGSATSTQSGGYELTNEVDSSFSTIGQGYPDLSGAHGRCPPGYNFNLETRTCDGYYCIWSQPVSFILGH